MDAFDIADVGIAKARKLADEVGVRVNFTVTDCDAFPWRPSTYDGVAAIFVQFADPELREYEAELAEGTGHRGRSALIGLVARKR